MRLNAPAVQQQTSLELIDPSGGFAPIAATLGYDPQRDPYAVTAGFAVGDTPIVWTFARDLLVNGLHEPTGDGDVHVWPAVDESGVPVVALELNSPDGSALLQIRSSEVERFLSRSLRSVPRGQEGEHLDLDGLIRRMLATG